MTANQGPRLIVRRSHFDHPKCKLSGFIEGHPFNSALQVILPGAAENFHQGPPAQSISTLISGRAYHLLRCNLAALADEDFVERHVRPEAAHFCALSVNTPLDRTDAAAVLPDGRLVLAVTEETHQKLGLVGSKKAGGYHIEVNLLAKKFRSGAHYYERVKARLQDHTAPLDMLCLKLLDGASVDPQCSALPGVGFSKQQFPTYTAEVMHSVHAPDLARLGVGLQPGPAHPVPTQDVWGGEDITETLMSIHEWLSVIACGLTGDAMHWKGADVPAPSSEPVDIMRMQWQGLLPPCSIADAVGLCREAVQTGACPWAAACVWGFADAPTSWHGVEHGRGSLMGGENDYMVLVLPDGQYVLFVMVGEGAGYTKI